MASGVLLASLADGVLQDVLGNALANHSVYVYQRGTTTQVQVYQDAALTQTLTQPLNTSSTGAVPGYVAGGQSIDLVDQTTGNRMPAEPLAASSVAANSSKNVLNQGLVWNGSAWVNGGRFARRDPRQFFGVYRKTFKNGPGLANVSGLSVNANGNLIATTVGVQGQGDLTLPATFDQTKPFAAGALIRVGATDDAGQILVQITDGSTAAGVQWSYDATNGLRGFVGGSQVIVATGTTAGLYEFYVFSDGTNWTSGLRPLTGASLGAVNTYTVGSATGSRPDDYYIKQATNINIGGGTGSPGTLWAAGLNKLRLVTSTKTHEILGAFFNTGNVTGNTGTGIGIARPQGGAVGGAADAVGPFKYGNATHVPVYAGTDYDETLRVPAGYDGYSPIDLIVVGHPNASTATLGANRSDAGGGTVHAALLDAGYMLLYVRGDTASYTSAGASPWGGNTGMAARKVAIDQTLAAFPQIRNVFWLGQSMGNLDGLMFHAQYPGFLRGLVGLSGVCNLSYAYNTEGFSSAINTGLGTSLAGGLDHDPVLRPSSWSDLPILHYHGDADTTIHKTNHPDTLAPLIASAGGSMSVINCPGGGHLDATFWSGVSPTTIVSFLQGLS